MDELSLITQARVGSKRLPNKIFLKIENKALIDHFIYRAKKIQGVDKIIFAIPNTIENDELEGYLKNSMVEVFRGSETDVLLRYSGACKVFNPKIIMRITSDCPLFDINVAEKLIYFFKNKKLDYASNNLNKCWPHGLDVEIFSREILDKACVNSKNDYEREHVTPWIRNDVKVKKDNLDCFLDLNSKVRLTIDYKEDFKFLDMLSQKTSTSFSDLTILEIDKIIKKYPYLLEINENRNIRINDDDS